MPKPISFEENYENAVSATYKIIDADRDKKGLFRKPNLVLVGKWGSIAEIRKYGSLEHITEFKPLDSDSSITRPFSVNWINIKVTRADYAEFIPLLFELKDDLSNDILAVASAIECFGHVNSLSKYIDKSLVPFEVKNYKANNAIFDRQERLILSAHTPWRDKDRGDVFHFQQHLNLASDSDLHVLLLLAACSFLRKPS